MHVKEGRVAERYQPGVARQQHQAKPGNAVNHDEGKLGGVVLRQHPRGSEQQREQQGVPELLDSVRQQPQVLVVISLE
jgi:hypothetical protein